MNAFAHKAQTNCLAGIKSWRTIYIKFFIAVIMNDDFAIINLFSSAGKFALDRHQRESP